MAEQAASRFVWVCSLVVIRIKSIKRVPSPPRDKAPQLPLVLASTIDPSQLLDFLLNELGAFFFFKKQESYYVAQASLTLIFLSQILEQVLGL